MYNMAEQTKTIKKGETTRAVGRRKTASARVRLALGKGNVVVNGKDLKEYFPTLILQQEVLSPLKAIGKESDMDVSVKVAGGGVHGQAGAARHGIARALIEWDEGFRAVLKAAGFLTRDSRMRERKKYGKRRARRGHQWKKR